VAHVIYAVIKLYKG